MGAAALVLGIIAILLSFLGGVGGIVLGVVAVLLGVLGRRAAERDGLPTGTATGGLVTGIVAIVLGGVVLATCVKCAGCAVDVARQVARMGEAQGTINEITGLEQAYYEAEQVDRDGDLRPKRFVSAGPTPAKVPCMEQPVVVTPDEWKAGGWDAIHFSSDAPQKFQYQAVASGTGKEATLEVIVRTDPRCNGTVADFRQRMSIDAEGHPQVELHHRRQGPRPRIGKALRILGHEVKTGAKPSPASSPSAGSP